MSEGTLTLRIFQQDMLEKFSRENVVNNMQESW